MQASTGVHISLCASLCCFPPFIVSLLRELRSLTACRVTASHFEFRMECIVRGCSQQCYWTLAYNDVRMVSRPAR